MKSPQCLEDSHGKFYFDDLSHFYLKNFGYYFLMYSGVPYFFIHLSIYQTFIKSLLLSTYPEVSMNKKVNKNRAGVLLSPSINGRGRCVKAITKCMMSMEVLSALAPREKKT